MMSVKVTDKKMSRKSLASQLVGMTSILLVMVVFASGCGSSPYSEADPNESSPPIGGNPHNPPGGGSGDDDPIVSDLPSPSRLNFTVTSSDQSSLVTTVNTDTLLKVRVRAIDAGTIAAPGYGFSANYSCIRVTVDVNGVRKTTGLINIPSANPRCVGATDYADLNFSSEVGAAMGPFKVSVTNVQYDYYCKLWHNADYATRQTMGPATLWCPVTTIRASHTVKGTIQVQTNSTGNLN